MLYSGFEKDKDYLTNKFRKPTLDPATGVPYTEFRDLVLEFAQGLRGQPVPVLKAHCFEFVCRFRDNR